MYSACWWISTNRHEFAGRRILNLMGSTEDFKSHNIIYQQFMLILNVYFVHRYFWIAFNGEEFVEADKSDK